MLKIYGHELPDLGIVTKTDKHLYLDIDGKDLGEFETLNLPPTETYIITTKSLNLLDHVIFKGYYNIACVERLSQISANFINKFLKTDYQENYLKVVSNRIATLYVHSGAEVEELSKALYALKNDDSVTFVDTMIVSLDTIIEKLDTIAELSAFAKSLQNNSSTYIEAIKNVSRLEEELGKAEKYRELYERQKSSDATNAAHISSLKAEIEGLKERISARTVTPAEIHNSADYKSLKARYESVLEAKADLEASFNSYKQTVETNNTTANGLVALNQQLNDELRKIKEQKISVTIANKLPIFTNSTTLSAKHIIYFKEVRPAIYINSLIYWLNSSFNVYSKARKESYLILVIDPLTDEYAERKYIKHKWNVGKYTDNMSVLVVPPLRFSTLKTTYHIDSYDNLICIDRCHVDVDVFNMTKVKPYYLINTVNDVSDFGLDGTRCIMFGNKVPAMSKSANDTPSRHVETWNEMLNSAEIMTRAGKHSKDGVFPGILRENGVYWQ